MNKTYIFIFLGLFVILLNSNVLAEQSEIPVVKNGECINIKQTCANCTYINVSITAPPNQTLVLVNTSMNRVSKNLWILQFCDTSESGEYLYDTFGDLDGNVVTDSVSFIANPIGKILTSGQSILYFLILFISFALFLVTTIFGLYVPSKNDTDQMTGYVIAVSNLKYVKLFMLSISYLLLMLILYFGWIVSFGYLDMDFLGTLFQFGFWTSVILIVPLFVIGTWILISNLVRDQKVGEMLGRGLKVR